MIKGKINLYFTLLFFLTSCSQEMPEGVASALEHLPETLDFNVHVKPILSDRCFACHGPDEAKRKAGLRLDQAESAYARLPEHPDKYPIRPGKPGASEVVHRMVSEDPELMMPPPESDLQLSPYEKAVLIRWIDQGAVYQPHWAFIKPQRKTPPELDSPHAVDHPIDRFIRRKIAQKGWQSAPEADKEILLRRLSFDLTGLPPSLEEMDAFLADRSPDAYEKVVDRLLDSPHYGERMATDWMDVARFADTHGYTVDRYRDMSPWRDWVIKAFNKNMPYDQFITWQLAGDLLPGATKEQVLATGFNRNHQQNMEGGIVEEEFRVEYVADRTNTLGKAFLGLTMECARCHDHKYDPISQKNYYQLFSFFNNVKEAGQISWDNATPVPSMMLSEEKVDSVLQFIQEQVENKEQEIVAIDQQAASRFEQWLSNERLQIKPSESSLKGLIAHYQLDNLQLSNRLIPGQKGKMKTQQVSTQPVLVYGYQGKGLLLDGDAWLDLGTVGAFDRHEPFSIGIWVNLPASLKNGVLFHKGDGAALYNWRGYHLAMKENRLEMLLAHTAPYNAVIEYGGDLPRNQFIHLTMTYDGSSKADGVKVYLNGQELATTVENDNLYKSICFNVANRPEAGLQIGARWRGIGVKGAVVDDITVFQRELTTLEVQQLHDREAFRELLQKPTALLSGNEKQTLKLYYQVQAVPNRTTKLNELKTLRRKAHEITDTLQEVMVMREMKTPRPTYILERGQYDALGALVTPNTPESLLPMPDHFPKNRLGLAQWLFHEDHPLTARVAVNRLWQQFFGQGIVRTTEDFGNQGELPSHPELLDWLATAFMDSDWDLKKMVKLIVTSATYRQSSKTSELLAGEDPQNRFLARGPSQRLTAEMLRDNALAAGGLLVKKIGGPSVKPYQPDGLWRINGSTYRQDEGQRLYRRSLYTFWKRTIPHPTQATFDAPARDNCTVRRQKTSTPLQALVLLNDPVYVEAAKVLGQKISRIQDQTTALQAAFRLLTGRRATEEELNLLIDLQRSEYEKFVQYPDKSAGWIRAGEYQLDENIEPARLAANTVVASTIINADATIVKR